MNKVIDEDHRIIEDNGNKEKKRISFKGSVVSFFRNITVEPTMSLYIIAYLTSNMTITNLSLEKACRVNLNFTDEICTAMRNQELESQNVYEMESQQLVTSALAWKTYLTATIPCFIGLFVGPWQDKTGRRKLFVIIPIVGQILAGFNNMTNVYFMNELNLQVLVFSDALIEALSGGSGVLLITVYAFISAITSEKNRTFRLGMVSLSFTASFPLGTILSGFALASFGYYGAFEVAMGLHFINFIYNVFILKDPKRSREQKQHDNKGFIYFMRTFFDLYNIKESIAVVFKKGTNRRRLRMIVLLCVVTVLYGPTYGETSVLYLSTRYRFNWDEVQFSVFQTYNFITHTIGTVFSITVFSKYLQWHDSMLGIISTVSKIAASFIYCFATSAKVFYFAPLVEILSGNSLLALRSIVSKLVEKNELGKVNSIFGLTENLMPLVYVPLYTQVYSATIDILPGLVFLMGSCMMLPATIVFVWLFVEHRRKQKETTRE